MIMIWQSLSLVRWSDPSFRDSPRTLHQLTDYPNEWAAALLSSDHYTQCGDSDTDILASSDQCYTKSYWVSRSHLKTSLSQYRCYFAIIFRKVPEDDKLKSVRLGQSHYNSIPPISYRLSLYCQYHISIFKTDNLNKGRPQIFAHFLRTSFMDDPIENSIFTIPKENIKLFLLRKLHYLKTIS